MPLVLARLATADVVCTLEVNQMVQLGRADVAQTPQNVSRKTLSLHWDGKLAALTPQTPTATVHPRKSSRRKVHAPTTCFLVSGDVIYISSSPRMEPCLLCEVADGEVSATELKSAVEAAQEWLDSHSRRDQTLMMQQALTSGQQGILILKLKNERLNSLFTDGRQYFRSHFQPKFLGSLRNAKFGLSSSSPIRSLNLSITFPTGTDSTPKTKLVALELVFTPTAILEAIDSVTGDGTTLELNPGGGILSHLLTYLEHQRSVLTALQQRRTFFEEYVESCSGAELERVEACRQAIDDQEMELRPILESKRARLQAVQVECESLDA